MRIYILSEQDSKPQLKSLNLQKGLQELPLMLITRVLLVSEFSCIDKTT